MRTRIAAAMAVTIGALCGAAGLTWAQGSKIAVVDMRGVIEQYKGWQDRVQQLNDFRFERERQYRAAVRVAYLTPEEKTEYQALERDPAPTLERLRRLIELRDKSTQMEEELNVLSKVDESELTPAQIKRRDDLQAIYNQSQQELDALQKRLNKEIEDKDRQLAEEADKEIKDAIAAYAKEKQYDIVLAKDTVVWGGTDITDQIVDRLNKGAS
jgi:Skp family chaperone for outer membrane proteins